MAAPQSRTSVLFVIDDDDPLLEARVRRARRSNRGFHLELSRQLDPTSTAALFVVPAALVNTILAPDGRLALPVIAYGAETGLAAAFLRGCVDYLRDPWTLTELELRVGRWLQEHRPPRRFGGGLWLDGTTLHGPAAAVALSVAEARLLGMLLLNAGRVTSREALFYRLWGRLPATPSRAVDVHVAALRRKIRTALGGGGASGGGGTIRDAGGRANADAPADTRAGAAAGGLTITAVRGDGYLLAGADAR